ncbi:MAG: caspase family protein, partial [Mariprofundaceae bacterium]
MKRIYLLLLCTLLLVPALSEASRGITVKLKASEQAGAADAGNVQLYASSYALVIGNDAYNNGWPRLSNGVKDAQMIAQALKQKGFQVSLKTNLDSTALKQAFEEFFVLKGQDPKSRLFVWFAGHGHTLGGEGFLIPTDAPLPTNAKAMFKLKSLSLRRFGEYVRLAQSKHAFTIFDACFAGTVFESQRSVPPAAVTRATTLPVRQFLSSGDANQTVSDNGSFRKLFIRALNGEERGDANGDGYLTASELGMYLTDRVTNLTKARQTPRYGKLNDMNWDRGDFVFVLPNNAIGASVTSAPAIAMTGKPRVVVDAPKYSLTINVTPSDAKIRILNIGPKYRAGMQLPSGRYHLSASKSGFKSKDKWIEIKGNDLEHGITLEATIDAAMQRRADRYLISAEDAMDAKDYAAVIKQINKVKALNVSLPVEFDYHLANALLETGEFDAARTSADAYLDKTDRKAEFYRKAIRLQSRADVMEEELLAKEKKRKAAEEQLKQYGFELVEIPSGSFQMGSQEGADEQPIHTVHINSFKMMKTEVTQGLWQSIMGSNPSNFRGDNNPVEQVSWDDIQVFIRKLNSQTGQS